MKIREGRERERDRERKREREREGEISKRSTFSLSKHPFLPIFTYLTDGLSHDFVQLDMTGFRHCGEGGEDRSGNTDQGSAACPIQNEHLTLYVNKLICQ